MLFVKRSAILRMGIFPCTMQNESGAPIVDAPPLIVVLRSGLLALRCYSVSCRNPLVCTPDVDAAAAVVVGVVAIAAVRGLYVSV